ncbi:hypothetical protein RUM43_001474 [Polyplax serrata]|uniref:Uncharacterized protein n=1 Tax=Polyplax serrata TaxID=468196 RepID=A0AAN8SDY2_POLSC
MSLDPTCNKPIFQTSLSLSTDAPISHRKAQVSSCVDSDSTLPILEITTERFHTPTEVLSGFQ